MGWTAGAALYGSFFSLLAHKIDAAPEPVAADRVAMARRVWQWSGEDDFYACEMECDESLIALGLASRETRDDGSNAIKYVPYGDRENDGDGGEDE